MRTLFPALLAALVLALSGCRMPCCPDTAEEAGLPVRLHTRPAPPPAETTLDGPTRSDR